MIKRLVLVPALVLLCLLIPASSPAVAPVRSIIVYGESGVVGTFTIARCELRKAFGVPYFQAKAISTNGQSRLYVGVNEFRGFHREYEVELGSPGRTPLIIFNETFNTRKQFSNFWVPPVEATTSGRIRFREGGHLLDVSYGPAMYDSHAERTVSLTGVLECEYPKKRKGGKKG